MLKKLLEHTRLLDKVQKETAHSSDSDDSEMSAQSHRRTARSRLISNAKKKRMSIVTNQLLDLPGEDELAGFDMELDTARRFFNTVARWNPKERQVVVRADRGVEDVEETDLEGEEMDEDEDVELSS
jgi:hypothetical protein